MEKRGRQRQSYTSELLLIIREKFLEKFTVENQFLIPKRTDEFYSELAGELKKKNHVQTPVNIFHCVSRHFDEIQSYIFGAQSLALHDHKLR
jgi:hypothetical protein